MDFVTDYTRFDEAGQFWTSNSACDAASYTVNSLDEIPSGGASLLIERRLGVKKTEQIPFVLDQWIEAKAYCVPGVTIKSLAKQVGINPTYLSNYFNRTLGVTFQMWLHTLRIEEAKRLIASDPSMKMSAVAASVGIPLQYNFSRWFRTLTGMTANTWRNICQASVAEDTISSNL